MHQKKNEADKNIRKAQGFRLLLYNTAVAFTVSFSH